MTPRVCIAALVAGADFIRLLFWPSIWKIITEINMSERWISLIYFWNLNPSFVFAYLTSWMQENFFRSSLLPRCWKGRKYQYYFLETLDSHIRIIFIWLKLSGLTSLYQMRSLSWLTLLLMPNAKKEFLQLKRLNQSH